MSHVPFLAFRVTKQLKSNNEEYIIEMSMINDEDKVIPDLTLMSILIIIIIRLIRYTQLAAFRLTSPIYCSTKCILIGKPYLQGPRNLM